MNRREAIEQALTVCVERLDAVLRPWGFVFESEGCHSSHHGPYARGHYVRGETRIGLSCRATIDGISYQHTFITEHPTWRAAEQFTLGHNELMKALDHAGDCQLVSSENAWVARDGGDPVTALIHDLKLIAPVLREPDDEFFAVIRRGSRGYSAGP